MTLERELDRKDNIDRENGLSNRLKSRVRDERESRKEGDERSRQTILDKLREKLGEYG